MKKRIILLSTMLLSILSIAGTKEDYENAINKYNKSEDLVSFETALKQLSNQKSDEYTRKANLTLLDIKLKQNKVADAQYYAEKLVNDTKAPKEIREQGYLALYQIYDVDPKKRLEVIEKLLSLRPDSLNYKIYQISDYVDAQNKAKADQLYNKLTNNMYLDEKEVINTKIAENLIQKNKFNDARTYLDKNSKLNLKKGLIDRDYFMAIISVRENKLSDAIKYILSADKLTDGVDPTIKSAMINIYDLSNKQDEALKEAVKLQKLSPTVDTYLQTIILAEKYNKQDVVNSTLNELKAALPPKDAKTLDEQLVKIFFNNRDFATAKKYANKLVESKDYNGYLLLSQIAAFQNNRAEALKYINLAKQHKVPGAEKFEKDILSK